MIKRYFQSHLNRNFSIAIIWINGGSDFDADGKKGINKILCSLLTRGCEGFDNLELSDFIESHGAELNHEVFEDGMFISLKSLNAHFNKLFPLLDLIISKPLLSEGQFKIVKKSILNSIKKDKENPFNISFEKWRKVVYSQHPYAFNCGGYEKDILSIRYSDILSEYKDFNCREKYLISNNVEINETSTKDFEKFNFTKKRIFPNYDLSPESRFVSSHNKSNQLILMLGNQTCSRKSIEYWPLKILESHLSFGMSSILFKLFREQNGLTYDVGVFNPIRKENAPFLIYLSVSNKNAIIAFQLLYKLWKELLFSLISDEEIFLAKEKLKSSFLISNQSLDVILQRDLQLISYGIYPSSKDYSFKEIEEISAKDIQKLTTKYFSKPFLSITGDKNICNDIKRKWVNNS